MWEIIGCYGLLLACVLGPTIMWAVGVITFEWMMQLALASDVYTKTPSAEFGTGNAYTVGQTFGFTFFYFGLLFLYLVIGAGLGIFTAARVARFSRWWSQRTAMPVLVMTLLNGIINLVGSSFLITLISVEFHYPQGKNPGSPKKVRMVVILSLKEFRLMKLASECRSILVMHRILTCNPQENRYSSPQRVHILSAFEKDVNLDIPCYV